MGLYAKYLLPKIIHLACSAGPAMRQREKVVPHAHGEVLEIGIGSGLNLPFYEPGRVGSVSGLDPSAELLRRAAGAVETVPFDVKLVIGSAEEIPFESGRFDTIVMTYTLCSIPDPGRALREIARVLDPRGALLFCEHGAAPDESVRRWQDRLDPVWRRVGGGCHLNRDIPRLVRAAGFEVAALASMYLPGWRPGSFNYWGRATTPGTSSG